MANEISLTAKLNVSKGGASATNLTSTESLDQAGANSTGVVQDIGASAAYVAVELGSITATAGYWLLIYNMAIVDSLNPTLNHVVVSFDGGTTHHATIPPAAFFGPVRVGPSSSATVQIAAATINVSTGEETLVATANTVNLIACEI